MSSKQFFQTAALATIKICTNLAALQRRLLESEKEEEKR